MPETSLPLLQHLELKRDFDSQVLARVRDHFRYTSVDTTEDLRAVISKAGELVSAMTKPGEVAADEFVIVGPFSIVYKSKPYTFEVVRYESDYSVRVDPQEPRAEEITSELYPASNDDDDDDDGFEDTDELPKI